MPISQISLSNTFSQWLYSTQSIINEVNKIESGIYTKTANTFYITSPGLALSVVNTSSFGIVSANSLSVSANSSLKGVSATSISANNISSEIVYVSGNTLYISTNSPRVNSAIVVNRGEVANSANADAIIQWNESNRKWRIRDVTNPNFYSNIIDSSNYASSSSPGIVLIRDDISNNSSNVAASANSLNFVYNLALSGTSSINAYNTANVAFSGANLALSQANSAYQAANIAYDQAIYASGLASTAYGETTKIPFAYNTANLAYAQANTGVNIAIAAYNAANSAASNTTSAAAYVTANLAYSTANLSYVTANLAHQRSNSAYTTANLAYSTANSAYTTANLAYSTANSAYSQANVATILAANATYLSSGTVATARLGSGTANSNTYLAGDNSWKAAWINIQNDESTDSSYYLTMTSAVSGSWNSAYISSNKLSFNPLTGTLSATIFNSLSDITLKENFENIENPIEIINKINPLGFDWKGSGKKSYGVIAQELEKILPELVSENNGIKSVEYNSLMAFLIGAVQEMSERLDKLENK